MELLKQTFTLQMLPSVVSTIGAILSTHKQHDSATIVTLVGDLGAGKTTFVKALALQLGVTEVVTSPTFVVMRRYETADEMFTELVHIDAYRLESEDEIVPLQLLDVCSKTQTIVCIEWPSRIPAFLQSRPHIQISLQADGDEDARTVTVMSVDVV
jgi:tRNA threonylcarbamoyladenosine biosynthesis protein TsaE